MQKLISVDKTGRSSLVRIKRMGCLTSRIIPVVTFTALFIAACGGGGGSTDVTVLSPVPPVTTPGLARTSCGDYQGVEAANTWRFLGIRYAAPPVGVLRWRAPTAPTCPTTIVAATDYAPICPQTVNGVVSGNEDCLAVNIWTPRAAFGGTRAPIMLFIHGGGNVQGSAREEVEGGRVLYDGRALAEISGNVVVTVQYRLGALGWLVHPALDSEAADARAGNYGLEDLIAALRWVEREIGAFGGNRDRVMVFGESAGAVNICALLASPAAAGLFDAAIMQSGGCIADTREEALSSGVTLARNAGCASASDVIACLRSRSVAEILAALPAVASVGGPIPPFGPSVDDSLLPMSPLAQIRAAAHNRVPTIVGANGDELGRSVPLTFTQRDFDAALLAAFPSSTVRTQIAALYSAAEFGSARRAYIALTSDIRFVCPARTIARTLAAAQTPLVFRYHFTEVPDATESQPFGAFHGLELLYLFGVLDVRGYRPTVAEFALATDMQRYWGNVAAGGQPGGGALSLWTPYQTARDNHLVLEAGAVREQDGVNTVRCNFWDVSLRRTE